MVVHVCMVSYCNTRLLLLWPLTIGIFFLRPCGATRVGVGVGSRCFDWKRRLSLGPLGHRKSWFRRSKLGEFGHVAPGVGPTPPLCPRRGSTLISLLMTWLHCYVWCRWSHVGGSVRHISGWFRIVCYKLWSEVECRVHLPGRGYICVGARDIIIILLYTTHWDTGVVVGWDIILMGIYTWFSNLLSLHSNQMNNQLIVKK